MRSVDANENRRVLVIDDNPNIHEDFRKVLVADGSYDELADAEAAFFGTAIELDSGKPSFELDSAHQGQEALERVIAARDEHRPFAMAFVDMRMPPGWDGLTTIEQLWKADPDIQVVICTAYSDNTWSDIYDRLGPTDQLLILKKPFDNAEVCQLAVTLTTKWQLTQQARLKQEDLQRSVDEQRAIIQEREASLRQKSKLEAVGSLAAGVAHEFNNLLQVIRGYSQFAIDGVAGDDQRYQDLSNVIEAADRGAMITKQLLSFSRRRPATKATHKLNEIVDTTAKMVRPLLGDSIAIELDLDSEAGAVSADADILSQALLNLLINARDAMPEGGLLQIATARQELPDRRSSVVPNGLPSLRPGEYSVIALSDTGCGMAPETKERIFEPFFTTKKVGKGTGMGLAMVFGAIEDHGGAIMVDSTEGQGTTFRVFLPVVPDSLEKTMERTHDEDRASTTNGCEAILLDEDDPRVRDVVVSSSTMSGM